MSSLDLRLVKRALIGVGAAAVLLCAVFVVSIGGVMLGDRDKPQFPYELAIATAGAIYFGALSTHTWRGLQRAPDESEVGRTIRFLAQAVLGMFVPVALAAAFLLWFVFQPAY
jgi:succinate dehydrogenase hydrophobic anchor subunit